MRSGVSAEEVTTALTARFPVAVEPQQQPATTQQQSAAVMRALLVDALQDVVNSQTAALREDLAALRQESEAAKMEISALRDEVAALRAQLEERDRQMLAALTPLSEPKSRRWWAFWRRSSRG